MSKIESAINVNSYANINGNNSSDSDGNNNLYKVKLAFSPQELGVKADRPQTIVLTEQQVESKIFQKFGFNPKNRLQMEMLKLRFDTKNSPYSEIDWNKGKFVAQLNSDGHYEITVGLREKTLEALEGRLINAPANKGNNANLSDTTASRTGYDASRLKQKQLQQSLPKPDLTGLTPEQKELVLDLTQVGLSVVGIFDPTGIADGADAVISLGRGDYWGAGISALGIIPYLGDIAKIGKLPKLLKIIDNVVAMAKADGKFAKVVEPLLKGLKNAIDKLPIEKLPNWAKEPIRSLKNKIDDFFSSAAKNLDETKPTLPPDPNRVPDGSPQRPKKKDDPEKIRSLDRQNESAKTLAENGYQVKQLPESKIQGKKNPDFEIEGRTFDNYAPRETADASRIRSTFRDKMKDGQADRFVLNLDDSKVTVEEMKKHLEQYPLAGLKEIIIVKGGKAIPFFPFTK